MRILEISPTIQLYAKNECKRHPTVIRSQLRGHSLTQQRYSHTHKEAIRLVLVQVGVCWNICPRDQSRVDWLGIYFISCRYNNKGIASYYVTISAYQYWVNIIMSIEWLLIILKRPWSMYHYGKDNNDAVRLAYVWLITKCCYRALDANQTYGQWVGEPRCWTDPQWECYMGES